MGSFPISVFRIVDNSMEPTIWPGDFVIVDKWYSSLNSGDIVVLKHPKRKLYIVKRIKNIYGEKIFVQGDNREKSQDSRHFGAVEKKLVVGKMVFKI
jgi:nickel-type superoxide dismutase maturation protease